MLLPDIFRRNDFDVVPFKFEDLFDLDRKVLKTDIKELDDKYVFNVDMPGFNKEDVKLALEDGFLTVSAERSESKDEKDEKGNYVRRERYSGSCSRRCFVGDDVEAEDIKASMENGVLNIEIMKKEPKVEEKKENLITIEWEKRAYALFFIDFSVVFAYTINRS